METRSSNILSYSSASMAVKGKCMEPALPQAVMQCLSYPANASFDGFFPARTGGTQWCLYRGWRSSSHWDWWQEGRSSAAWCRSQAACFLQRQGSCSTSHPDARSAQAEGMFASCFINVSWAAWLFAHTYTLNRKPLRLNRFHWRWRRLEENELGLFRRPLHARLGPGRGIKVFCLFVSQIFLEIS